jgi:hypothetical protein
VVVWLDEGWQEGGGEDGARWQGGTRLGPMVVDDANADRVVACLGPPPLRPALLPNAGPANGQRSRTGA